MSWVPPKIFWVPTRLDLRGWIWIVCFGAVVEAIDRQSPGSGLFIILLGLVELSHGLMHIGKAGESLEQRVAKLEYLEQRVAKLERKVRAMKWHRKRQLRQFFLKAKPRNPVMG